MKYLNQGMYDVVEAAHLVRAAPSSLVRWASPTRKRKELVKPSLGTLYSFHDLISLMVVRELTNRRLSLETISAGIETLKRQLETASPLAHREFATVGKSFFAKSIEHDEWLDVGRGGQSAFEELVTHDLRRIEYGPDLLAAIWRPVDRVWVNPRVQAGASCIDQTRIPTATIFQAVEKGDAPEDVAGDYDLDFADVSAALEFEQELLEAA
jgi:uncharacterized protein (DUF433 family)